MPTIRQAPSPEQQVLDANAAFYSALESLNLAKMKAVWLHEDWVQCLHPGWSLICGWEAIEESFASIFRSATQLSATVSRSLARVLGEAAWVSSIEQVTMTMDGDFATARVETTHIFARRGGQWKMVHRHTTPVPGPGLAETSQSVH
ncbi:MAG: nuclear transport factor 2 family protein [Terriglobia bacterium]